jgi:hypothetical protein
MKRILAIALLALVGCASKPAANPVTKTEDDPRCEKFYEFANKTHSMIDFQELKKIAKAEGFELNEETDIFEMSIVQRMLHSSERCNETITCNQKNYCLSIIDLRDSTIIKPFKF